MERALVSPKDISGVLKRLYDLDVTEQETLQSYFDVNVYVTVELKTSNEFIPEVSPSGYVLKILNSIDSKLPDVIDAVVDVTDVLNENGVCTPQTVKNVHGKNFSLEQFRTNTGVKTDYFLIRLLVYIPGETLTDKSLTAEQCNQVGRLGGKIDRILKDTSYPALESCRTSWSSLSIPNLVNMVEYIEDEDNRSLINDIIKAFGENVVPNYAHLTPGLIHGDLNRGNIIVESNTITETLDKQHFTIKAVIDYGHLAVEFAVFEVAVILTYVMLDGKATDPLEAAGHALAGYLREYNLPAYDLDLLKDCICGRLAVSLVHGVYHYTRTQNEIYLETAKSGWALARRLWNSSKFEFHGGLQVVLDDYHFFKKFEL